MNNQKNNLTNSLSIIIVSYNICDVLRNCLNSIRNYQTSLCIQTILIDNNSNDKTIEMISSEFPEVKLIANKTNMGFAAANNQGIEIADSEFIILLNPDTLVTENSLDLMVAYLKNHPECGIVGPKLLNDDKTLQNGLRMFPNPWLVLARHCLLKKLTFFKNKIDHLHMRNVDLKIDHKVDQVSGAAMMFNSSLIENIGTLDERFFVFFEEVDLCKRTKDAGLEVHYYSTPEIYHLGGKCRDKVNVKAKFYYHESIIKYLNKHNPFPLNYFFSSFLKLLISCNIVLKFIADNLTYPFIILIFCCMPKMKNNKRITRHFNKALFRRKFLTSFLLKFLTTN